MPFENLWKFLQNTQTTDWMYLNEVSVNFTNSSIYTLNCNICVKFFCRFVYTWNTWFNIYTVMKISNIFAYCLIFSITFANKFLRLLNWEQSSSSFIVLSGLEMNCDSPQVQSVRHYKTMNLRCILNVHRRPNRKIRIVNHIV